MKKVLYILIAAISVMAFSGCGMKNTVQIGTGDVNGTYYAYGTELAEILNNNSDVYFKVRKTAGSAANLRLISQEYVDIAFVQSDVMKDAYNGTGYFDKEYKGYSAIAWLYTEAIQVAVPKDSDINSISDLYGKSVSLGEKESGVLQNSKQILSAYGLNESMVDAKYLSYTDAAKAMKNGNLDAFFCTAGTPTRAITEISDDIKLIPIDGTVADRLTEQYNGYVKHTIKANTCLLYTSVFGNNSYNPDMLEKRITELMADDDVTSKKGIYEYLLSGKEKVLSIRAFTDSQKATAYAKQNGICPICQKHFELDRMHADHITPWHAGGKTVPENLQMLCRDCNLKKSGQE